MNAVRAAISPKSVEALVQRLSHSAAAYLALFAGLGAVLAYLHD